MDDPSAEIKKVQEPLCLGLEWGPIKNNHMESGVVLH